MQNVENKKLWPVVSELELGYQRSRCLNLTVSGTNGKSSTVALIEQVLRSCDRKTLVVGNGDREFSDVIEHTRDLDFLTIEASATQLQGTEFFRPSVAVLLNIGFDHVDTFPTHADYIRAKAKLFCNQQPFDWAILQSEAWAQMRALNLPMPGKVITFSAQNRRADIFLDRTLLVSRIEDWAGPLLDLEQTSFRGPHHAENLMAVLAVSRVLRLPLGPAIAALKRCRPLSGCCDHVATIDGVRFVSDARSRNADSLRCAILSVPAQREPDIWLIAGGKESGLEYHDLGPLLSQRVKGVFLVGENVPRLRAAWSLFTPCRVANSLLEALSQAAKEAACGDTVLFSPACSSFDDSQNASHRGELFREAVEALARTTNGVTAKREHKMLNGGMELRAA